jgi:hypothetical protein
MSEEELIKTIKKNKPTLQELKMLFKKNNITSRDEIHHLMLKYNLLQYIKKDNQFMTMKKKADRNVDNAYKELSGNPFKNAMKELKESLKLQYTKKKTRKSRKSRKSKITRKIKK